MDLYISSLSISPPLPLTVIVATGKASGGGGAGIMSSIQTINAVSNSTAPSN